jgi:hypothetical protein
VLLRLIGSRSYEFHLACDTQVDALLGELFARCTEQIPQLVYAVLGNGDDVSDGLICDRLAGVRVLIHAGEQARRQRVAAEQFEQLNPKPIPCPDRMQVAVAEVRVTPHRNEEGALHMRGRGHVGSISANKAASACASLRHIEKAAPAAH